jgi:hypothetical protein
VYSVNGQLMNDTSMEGVPMHGGAISTGEFGSLMREIFEPHSQAEFGWDHWATLRGRRMAVFNYFIDSGHSSWSISYSAGPGDEQRIITAYKGLVYADENTGEIDRIKFEAVDIPKSFPVNEATEILDYDAVDISGQQYVHASGPAKLKERNRVPRLPEVRNGVEYHLRRGPECSAIITAEQDGRATGEPHQRQQSTRSGCGFAASGEATASQAIRTEERTRL